MRITVLAGGIGAATVTLMVRDVLFRNPPPLYVEPFQISRLQAGTPDRPIMPRTRLMLLTCTAAAVAWFDW